MSTTDLLVNFSITELFVHHTMVEFHLITANELTVPPGVLLINTSYSICPPDKIHEILLDLENLSQTSCRYIPYMSSQGYAQLSFEGCQVWLDIQISDMATSFRSHKLSLYPDAMLDQCVYSRTGHTLYQVNYTLWISLELNDKPLELLDLLIDTSTLLL